MTFAGLSFLFLFLPFSFLYYLVPSRFQNLAFFLLSLLFYFWGGGPFLLLLLASVGVNYGIGMLLDYFAEQEKKRKGVFLAGLLFNIGIVAFFKYLPVLLQAIFLPSGSHLPALNQAFPLGLSFYTFQGISYLIDTYRGDCPAQKNVLRLGVYLAAFPQITSGPIARYQKNIAPDLEKRPPIQWETASDCLDGFLRGLFKKVLIADQLGVLWQTVKDLNPASRPGGLAWLGILAFTFQIYFDFSGYSQMAISLAGLFGFHLPQNFNLPYLSRSVSAFWRRWHMSLGTWFREYVYIPLGGNRGRKGKTACNLLIVWGLTGLWHGGSWNFLLWGLYFGVLIIAERFFIGDFLKKWPAFCSTIYTFFLVVMGWVLFSFSQLDEIAAYFRALFTGNGLPFLSGGFFYYLFSYGGLFLISILFSTGLPGRFQEWASKRYPVAWALLYPIGMILLFFACLAFLVAGTYRVSLYAQF